MSDSHKADDSPESSISHDDWEEETLEPVLERFGEREDSFETTAGIEVDRLYTPDDIADLDYEEDLGYPGSYPFTRGIYPTMYRGRLWTMRQYSGMGTAEETNERYKYLLEEGQTGLSVAMDLPSQIGYDSDDPQAKGEIGKVGVAIDSLRDMERVFEDIPLDEISTSMTINGTAAVMIAMYKALGEKRGVDGEELRGTMQNDILKEFAARGTWTLPVKPSMRLIVDTIEYCTDEMPNYNPISIAGAHFRDAGADPAEEMAYTLADGVAYVRACLDRGLNVDDFAPQLSWFFYTYTNFFEEVAKYRAGRRLWADIMREEFEAENPKSWQFRAGCVCGGQSLTKEEPMNNVARVAIEMMAASAAGLQSVFTAAYDEAFSIPTEESARIALRTQQIVAHETDMAMTADPLGGSYFVEKLTNDMEDRILEIMDKIEERGGMVECVEDGYIQRRLSQRAYEYQKEVESGERVVVGKNKFASDEKEQIETYSVEEEVEQSQLDRLESLREKRDDEAVEASLAALRSAAEGDENMMPYLVDAVKAYATVGEIMGTLRDVFGEYQPPQAI
jgi:methylmalonyl-CoA mutase N-terminal domain/subunit